VFQLLATCCHVVYYSRTPEEVASGESNTGDNAGAVVTAVRSDV
jgi:hypothetical protein